VALGFDAGLTERDDERFFDLAEIPVQILPMALEVEDGVANELSRPVEGDVAAALHLVDLDAASPQTLGRRHDVRLLRGATEGHDRGMLEQEQHILVELASDATPREIALELKGNLVGDGSQLRR
jgi:hypothetical protein